MNRVAAGLLGSVFSIIILALYLTSDHYQDNWVWSQMRTQLTTEHVREISLGGAVLPREVQTLVLAQLREAEFEKSNRVGHGPTPQRTLRIELTDGAALNVGHWGGATFEWSPRHIDAESQFLVTHEELGEWIASQDLSAK